MTTKEINVREKRAELLALWERMFRLCEAQVGKMEQGETDLSASMLKELNAFMKQSATTLVELEKAQKEDLERELQESLSGEADETEEAAEDDSWAMPFPCFGDAPEAVQALAEETEEDPLEVPLEY